MWNLQELVKYSAGSHACIEGKYVPARPLNGTRQYAGLLNRLRDAWAVFQCKAEAFKWPAGQ